MQLDKINMSDILKYLVKKVEEEHKVTKAKAKLLIVNAMTYNSVINEIQAKVSALIEDEEVEKEANQ